MLFGSDLMQFLLEHQWNIFIGLEVASLIFLLAFLVIRYAFTKQRISDLFLGLFILCIVLEAILAWLIYQETGEIDTFQIVIAIFIVYAFTFGIGDFKKLDHFIKARWQMARNKSVDERTYTKNGSGKRSESNCKEIPALVVYACSYFCGGPCCFLD